MRIEVRNLSKTMRGVPVLDNVNVDFESGHIYGIVGENGCGKTMLLRSVSGLFVPTSGSVSVDGKRLHKDISFPPEMGILIEKPEFLNNLSGLENLKLLAEIVPKHSRRKAREVLRGAEKEPSRGRAREISKDMKAESEWGNMQDASPESGWQHIRGYGQKEMRKTLGENKKGCKNPRENGKEITKALEKDRKGCMKAPGENTKRCGEISEETIKAYMRMFDLDPEDKKPVRKYSLGMKQKLGIIQAVMENQRLLVLDEAFNALDEKTVSAFRELLLEYRRSGRLILLTSHHKEDIEMLCDCVYRMSGGRIVETVEASV